MSAPADSSLGLANGRRWGAQVTDGELLEWSVEASRGLLQGPLDLEFLRGRRLLLTLEPGQYALLLRDGELQAVFLDGGHHLEIGQADRQINPRCQILFLAAERPLTLRWTKAAPLLPPGLPEAPVIGVCTLEVEAPVRFYEQLLAKHPDQDDAALTRRIDGTVREALGDLLADADANGTASGTELQSRLPRLEPADLNDLLSACGLVCTHLAVYTATPPVESGSFETAGQLPGLDHN